VDLLEHQGKQLFARHGIAVPRGNVATSVDDAVNVSDALGYPSVVKAQAQIGGRGKLGGIKLAGSRVQARTHSEAILAMEIRGLRVQEVMGGGGFADRGRVLRLGRRPGPDGRQFRYVTPRRPTKRG